jgi:hypothetical protein
MTTTAGYQYLSEQLRELAAQHEEVGEARGEARGEGRSVLTVLDARGIAVPADIHDRILACTDLAQLEIWLRRAVTAASAEEVIGE